MNRLCAEPFLVLERTARLSAGLEYAIASGRKPSELQLNMTDAVRRGFRLIPETLFHSGGLRGANEMHVIMERTADPGPEPEYVVAEDETELSNLFARGYSYVGDSIVMRLRSR